MFRIYKMSSVLRIRIHDPRHTAASLMIATGADIASVSGRLGHANVAITWSIYTHAFVGGCRNGESIVSN